MVADEIQSGLARTGETFACDHEGVVPDVYILGKALAGGLYPLSAVAADHGVLDVITPGSHGSTFGGNPLAARIGREVVAMLRTGEFQERSTRLGAVMAQGLRSLVGQGVLAVRCRGLWAGVDVDPALVTGRELCEALLRRGVLAKDTHGSTIRLAPRWWRPRTTSSSWSTRSGVRSPTRPRRRGPAPPGGGAGWSPVRLTSCQG